MTAKTRNDILGLEYDWLAVDQEGHVALFSTAGGGRAPQAVLEDTDVHDAGLDALMALEPHSSLRFGRELKVGLKNTWNEAARRGVFAFDSDPHGAPYQLVAAPKHPILLHEAPGPTAIAAGAVKLPHLRFTEMEQAETTDVGG